MRHLRGLLIFYRQIWPFTLTISLAMWFMADFPLITSRGFMIFAARFFWLRSLSQLVIWYLFRLTNRRGFVFYHHFGLSQTELAIGSYLLDLLTFSLWICLLSVLLS